MPKGSEEIARSFYGGLLGLAEIPKPEALRGRGGVWFDAGGLDIHISVEENRSGSDSYRHFGLACADVEGVRAGERGFIGREHAARFERKRLTLSPERHASIGTRTAAQLVL